LLAVVVVELQVLHLQMLHQLLEEQVVVLVLLHPRQPLARQAQQIITVFLQQQVLLVQEHLGTQALVVVL
jgi:hypothetical protein